MAKLKTKWIEDAAVTKEKVNSDVAGEGLKKVAIADPISMDIPGLTELLQAENNDEFVIWDATAGEHKRIKRSELLGDVAQLATQIAFTGDTTDTSDTDVLIAGLTYTPGAGKYMIFVGGATALSVKNRTMWISLYAAGTKVLVSEIEFEPGEAMQYVPFAITGILVTVGDGEAIEVRWRRDSGTPVPTMHFQNRHLTVVEIIEP